MSIYLIQPEELIGTNRFKIGCSKSDKINRVLSYKKGSRILFATIIQEPFKLEKIIKDEFNNHFELIGGKEFFEGDEEQILNLFKQLVETYSNTEPVKTPKKVTKKKSTTKTKKNSTTKIKKEPKIVKEEEEEEEDIPDEPLIENISNIFPKYKNDTIFGGTHNLINININIQSKILTVYFIENINNCSSFSIKIENSSYYNSLIDNKILEHNMIYNLTNQNLIKMLNKYKSKFNIVNPYMNYSTAPKSYNDYETNLQKMLGNYRQEPVIIYNLQDYINFHNNNLTDQCKFIQKTELIERYIIADTIINNILFCNNHSTNEEYIFNIKKNMYKNKITEKIINSPEYTFKLFKYNDVFIEDSFIYNYLPIHIEIYDNTQYYILNINHKYVDTQTNKIHKPFFLTKCSPNSTNIMYGSDLWFKDIKIIYNAEFFNKFINKYNQITHGKECLNTDKNTELLLNLFNENCKKTIQEPIQPNPTDQAIAKFQ